ncbi:unnamed protein product, partial [Staurois parvus]
MKTASTNICERTGLSEELSVLKCGTVIGCHLCNKSIHEISFLLNIPQSTVSGIITTWNWEQQHLSHEVRHMQWRCVLWSDEPHFSVWQTDGCVWVWRLAGEWYLPDFIVPSV